MYVCAYTCIRVCVYVCICIACEDRAESFDQRWIIDRDRDHKRWTRAIANDSDVEQDIVINVYKLIFVKNVSSLAGKPTSRLPRTPNGRKRREDRPFSTKDPKKEETGYDERENRKASSLSRIYWLWGEYEKKEKWTGEREIFKPSSIMASFFFLFFLQSKKAWK